VSRAGSDVNLLLFDVLPRVAPGVYVHLHDIFYPFEYPEAWVYGGRAWTENYVLRAFLMHNHDYEITLFGHYLHLHHAETMERLLPLTRQNWGGCFWMRKR
jgi:hypothetical protein